MSRLTVYAEAAPERSLSRTSDAAAIADGLAEIGVVFERWRAGQALAADADDQAVLHAYAADIARLKAQGGYVTTDMLRMLPDNPKAAELRARFLFEHAHAEDEVRFFVEGAAQFYLHKAGKVFAVLCEAGDLISVPAMTPHWFDMGPRPRFTAIRLFLTPEGWVAEATGSDIADRFPRFEPEPA